MIWTWTRLKGVSGRCGVRYVLDGTDFSVKHCGHPTALWPWYGERRGYDGMILAPNGRAFQYLRDAQAAVIEVAKESKENDTNAANTCAPSGR